MNTSWKIKSTNATHMFCEQIGLSINWVVVGSNAEKFASIEGSTNFPKVEFIDKDLVLIKLKEKLGKNKVDEIEAELAYLIA
jgi:hypothetical protein